MNEIEPRCAMEIARRVVVDRSANPEEDDPEDRIVVVAALKCPIDEHTCKVWGDRRSGRLIKLWIEEPAEGCEKQGYEVEW